MQALSSPRQVFSSQRSSRPLPQRRAPVKVCALFGFGKKAGEKSEKDLDKDEQFRIQQEVLARRRGGDWQKEVKERRAKVRRYMTDPEFKKQIDAEKRERFKAQLAEKEAQTPKFGIIVPLIPIGLPDYDIGEERFDLRLPHVDKGWEDDELANDPLGLKQLGKAFGFGKKKKEETEPGSSGSKRSGRR